MKSLNPPSEIQTDYRLYVPSAEEWSAHVKTGWEKEYCYLKNAGEEFFHLLVGGELYLQKGDEKLCLTCAARVGVITTDRLHWQKTKSPNGQPLI